MLQMSAQAAKLFGSLREESRVAVYLFGGDMYTTNKEGDYLDIKDGMLTYFPTKKAAPGVDPWRVGNRIITKPGKGVRKFLTQHVQARLNDTDYEYFANCVKAGKVIQEAVFEVVSGEAIRFWYNQRNYSTSKNIGTLARSCMKNAHHAESLDLYVLNPKQIKMLILRDTTENKLLGRALLWYVGDHVYMDRIYTSDAARREFVLYAQKQGWHVRRYNTYSDPEYWIDPKGKYHVRTISIDLDWVPPTNNYPFLDTFSYISTEERKISNARFPQWTHYLHNTDGTGDVRHP